MSLLYDQYGAPISNRSFIKAADNGGNRMPPEVIRPMDPLKRLVNRRDWLTLSYLGEKVHFNFGLAEGIVSQRAMFAVTGGWFPIFMGADQEWGDVAIDVLVNKWFPYSNVAGPNIDFNTGLYMDSEGIDYSGDCVTLLTKSQDGEGDWPLLQRLPNRRIGQWDQAETVADGEFKGAAIENGIIKNKYGYPIGYRILGENRGEFKDVPADSVVHTYEPKRADQSRGFPLFTAVLDEFRSSMQSKDWEMMCMLATSSIIMMETNETGDAAEGTGGNDPLNADGLPTSTGDPEMKTFLGGMIRYFRANSGSKLEQFLHQRPGSDWETFNDRLHRICCVAANWPYSLIWKKDGTNGTATRADQNIARKSIADRQALLKYPAIRELRYAVSVLIKSGYIPPYKGKDIGGQLKWDFSMPPLMTIDEGRDRDNDREDFKMGFLTLETRALNMGTTAKKIRDTKEREATDLLERADRMAKASGKDFNLCLNLLQMTNPNGASAMPADQTQTTNQPDPATP